VQQQQQQLFGGSSLLGVLGRRQQHQLAVADATGRPLSAAVMPIDVDREAGYDTHLAYHLRQDTHRPNFQLLDTDRANSQVLDIRPADHQRVDTHRSNPQPLNTQLAHHQPVDTRVAYPQLLDIIPDKKDDLKNVDGYVDAPVVKGSPVPSVATSRNDAPISSAGGGGKASLTLAQLSTHLSAPSLTVSPSSASQETFTPGVPVRKEGVNMCTDSASVQYIARCNILSVLTFVFTNT
jgi:hypothetical protein